MLRTHYDANVILNASLRRSWERVVDCGLAVGQVHPPRWDQQSGFPIILLDIKSLYYCMAEDEECDCCECLCGCLSSSFAAILRGCGLCCLGICCPCDDDEPYTDLEEKQETGKAPKNDHSQIVTQAVAALIDDSYEVINIFSHLQ